jgi:hypothetical protein
MTPRFGATCMHSRSLSGKNIFVIMNQNLMSHKPMTPSGVSHSRASRLPVAQLFRIDEVYKFSDSSIHNISVTPTISVPYTIGGAGLRHFKLRQIQKIAHFE